MGGFKIRVVENIGEESLDVFGEPDTEFEVADGEFYDLEGDPWNNEFNGFESIEDINSYFGRKGRFQTIFELVED